MRNSTRTGLLLFMTLLIYSGAMYAQKKVNEKCNKDDDCKGYCVTVTVKGSKKKVCSDCDQNTLNNYSKEVGKYCKGLEGTGGWTPKSSKEYKLALADDGRVNAKVFDVMIDKAKKCVKARKTREDKCFDGGDKTHEDTADQAKGSLDDMIKHKKTMISHKQVFKGDKRVYNDLIKDFDIYCSTKLNLSKFEQDLKIAERAVNKGSTEECEKVLKYEDACYDCYKAAKNLFSKGFMSNKSNMPPVYLKIYEKIIDLEETFEAVKNECN